MHRGQIPTFVNIMGDKLDLADEQKARVSVIYLLALPQGTLGTDRHGPGEAASRPFNLPGEQLRLLKELAECRNGLSKAYNEVLKMQKDLIRQEHPGQSGP